MLGYSLVCRRSALARSVYLLAASMFFYYKASGWDLALLGLVCIANYGAAHAINICGGRTRKAALGAGVAINLLLLVYFKYADYAVSGINETFGTTLQASNVFAMLFNNYAGGNHFDASQILLPIGISFFIFQSIAYIIDVYRRNINPVRNIVHFCFFVCFFPQLVAGPIVRAKEFMPQIYSKYALTQQEFWQAAWLIVAGLIKKIVIADYIAFHYVDKMFDQPALYSGFELLMAVYGYAIQIYCDFSGYTDIAIGVAAVLGFRLPLNFNAPYRAHSPAEFWRRWHISLSSWLRDYLYIPLGGNRHGMRRTCLNIFIVMLLGGLWHGTGCEFILWGALHGIVLIAERCLKQLCRKRFAWLRVPRIVGVFITFHIVCFLWIFFRSQDISGAFAMISQMQSRMNTKIIPDICIAYLPIYTAIAAAYLLHFVPSIVKTWTRAKFVALPVGFKLIIIAALVFAMLQVSSSQSQPFIYFQF
jgi:D-alanyl-lipoteichoic acid acyltransferase DltB (MBOAT superfamily)